MEYSFLKLIHIISSTILFGTGIGTAFYMVMANRSHDIQVLKGTTTSVVFADWIFTMPAVIIQPLSGYLLMNVAVELFIYIYLVLFGAWILCINRSVLDTCCFYTNKTKILCRSS